MLETMKLVQVSPSVYQLAFLSPHGMMTQNIYLVEGNNGYCLIDAGLMPLAAQLIQLVARLCPPGLLNTLLVLDNSLYATSALPAWRKAGFRGEIVADWRTALELANAGVPGPFRYIHSAENLPVELAALRLHTVKSRPGVLYACHTNDQVLFSGTFASALGREFSDQAMSAGKAIQAYQAYMGGNEPPIGELLSAFDKKSLLLCPRFGPAVHSSALLSVQPPVSKNIASLVEEIQKLETEKFDLQSAMVLASDSALRDQLSGLYDRVYAEEFLLSLLGQATDFVAGFISIDRIKEYNRAAGVAAGDALIATMAGLLEEQTKQEYLFRWNGPVFLMISETGRNEAVTRFEELRAVVEAEQRFARVVTISVALVGSDEPKSQEAHQSLAELQTLARAKLKLAERRGGNIVLSDSDASIQEKTLALILDGNAVSANYLVEYLERQDFSAVTASVGAEALAMMDRYQPEVVIADLNLPQYDAFQIRAHMLASNDLRNIPMVLLVESKSASLVERAHGLNIYHVLEKPVILRELFGLLRHLTKWNSDDN